MVKKVQSSVGRVGAPCHRHAFHLHLQSTTVDGKAARLAILTDDGRVIASGNQVAKEVEAVALNSYRNFLKGQGYLRVHSKRSFNRDLASDADLVCDSPVKLTADGRLGS
jgi:hypothetical protein